MPFPMPIRPMRSTCIPGWLRDLCVARFEAANEKYGGLWATMLDLDTETIAEIADVVNYAEFGRERTVPRWVVWVIQFGCGLQARLVNRYFRGLPPLEDDWEDVAGDITALGADVSNERGTRNQ